MNTFEDKGAYQWAQEAYAALGVDTEAAIARLQTIPISLHCWQGDDVGGFETPGATSPVEGSRSPGTIPGRPVRSKNCRPISRRSIPSSRGSTG